MLSFLGERLLRWSCTRRSRGGNVGALGAQTALPKNVRKTERPQNEDHCRSAAPHCRLSDGLQASAPTVKYGERFARDSESRRVANECCARSV